VADFFAKRWGRWGEKGDQGTMGSGDRGTEGLGRETARVEDWLAVIGGPGLMLFLLCSGDGELSAKFGKVCWGSGVRDQGSGRTRVEVRGFPSISKW
jgi:hypothetical protein